MRLVFAGTPTAAVPSLRALLASRHEVVAALTRPDRPAGRGGAMRPSSVALAARDAGLQLLQPVSVRTPAFEAELRSLAPDVVAVVAFGALIPGRLLEIPTHGWINLHFSLLPAWRGAAPVPAAIRAGDEITGASAFLIEQDLDTGPVYGTVTEPIGPRDTAGELLHRLAESGARLLVATMDGIADGSLVPRPQSAEGVSYAGKITPADGEVDFATPSFAVDRQVRAVTPTPGAWVSSRWGRLGLGPVEPVAEPARGQDRLAPGEIAAGKREVLVGTGSGPVRLTTVQPAGKRPMPAADWARGARPEQRELLGPGRAGDSDGEGAGRGSDRGRSRARGTDGHGVGGGMPR